MRAKQYCFTLKNSKEERGKGSKGKNCLPGRNVAGLNEKNDGDEIRNLYREIEDWYREEETDSTVKAA